MELIFKKDALENSQQVAILSAQTPVAVLSFNEEHQVIAHNDVFFDMFGFAATGMLRKDLYQSLNAMLGQNHIRIEESLSTGNVGKIDFISPVPRSIELIAIQSKAESDPSLLLFRDTTGIENSYQALNAFIAETAHELRNPIGIIQGFAELLLTRDISISEQRILIERIYKQSINMGPLLNGVLEYTKINALGRQYLKSVKVSAIEILKDVIDNFSATGDSERIVFESDAEPGQIMVVKEKFEQIMTNLISNALKYSKASDGPVKITACISKPEKNLIISIQDSGCGMDEKTLSRLFTKFFRANQDDSVQGTGLGLVITKALVEQLRGKIYVQSQPGVGSIFQLIFPLVIEADNDESASNTGDMQ